MDIYDETAEKIWGGFNEGGGGKGYIAEVLRERFPESPATQHSLSVQRRAAVQVPATQDERELVTKVWRQGIDKAAALIAAHDAKLLEEAANRAKVYVDACYRYSAEYERDYWEIDEDDLRVAITGKGE